MTQEELQKCAAKLAELWTAVSKGKTLQLANSADVWADWEVTEHTSLSIKGLSRYRIKPEPRRYIICGGEICNECAPNELCSDAYWVEEVME